ncbi:NAD-dependent epimerase/dehydratase family protein [Shewanella sp. 5_MG-2023]|uniref:2-alkyl-3-oxoalkanoate reductase n=1 Tax=Shewanella sp. 5_MG-2023 TaxID=3062656 RepID=UPI0026E369BF|nr:2-alkyl-3-oxoalkanoate reductase [Shewanella sp. 5_MG-2023]MDO6641487.1 NAD-dependent epimerase/dehydratase family protein [Shewanella sp. 5_MG-2023]
MLELEMLLKPEQAALAALKSRVNKVFVTGAGGFLGKAICTRLRAAGIEVNGFARGEYPALTAMGVNMYQGDISDSDALAAAMQDCDLVFHVASKAGVWGDRDSYFAPNVNGTANILRACKALKINHVVYTSTPSVTFAGEDEAGIDESSPYAASFLNFYGHSKAIAEKMVLESNSAQLKTTALRPHLIWGPEDPHLVPRVIERAKLGKLKLVGKEDKLVDTIYVDNAAYAHILAALDLSQDKKCAGKAYFLSNDEPITMAAMLNNILACVDIDPVTKRVPAGVAYSAGVVLETIYKILGKQQEPIMTRFVARQLSTCHYFNISAAKKDLGYEALISIDEGMQRLKASLN